jgi:hypothetical protein
VANFKMSGNDLRDKSGNRIAHTQGNRMASVLCVAQALLPRGYASFGR